jgi:hypothetical protein
MRRQIAALLLLFTIAGCARIADVVPLAQSPIATPSHYYVPVALNAYEPPTWSAKKGLGTHYPQFCGDAALVGASWRYDWQDIDDCAGVADLPMLYNVRDVQVHILRRLPLGGDGPVLGFNEPDRPDQANLTAYEAARAWPDVEDLAGERMLVGPAISHEGLAWLPAFYQAHRVLWGHPPRMDGGLAVHCYLDDARQCQAVVQQVIGYAEDWDLPGVWVTEFMFWPWSPAKEAQARAFIGWMEQEPRVLGYAWFPTRLECGAWSWDQSCLFADNALITVDGQLTAWGRMYASVGGDE